MHLSFWDKITPLLGKYQKCTLKNLQLMLSLLITSKTVNLYKQKDYVQSLINCADTQILSHYQHLIRFMRGYSYTNIWFDCLQLSLSTINIRSNVYYLDATEWQFGKIKIHLLVLCVCFNDVAIPVYFRPYWHKGVLSEVARLRFIRRAMKVIDLKGKIIIADREFIGAKWFITLNELGIKFIMRVRDKMYKKELLNGTTYQKLQEKALKKGYSKAFISIEGITYRLEFWKNANDGEEKIIYLLTNILNKKVGKKYRQRWQIECCFKHLKTNGFDLEDMSWRELAKIRLCVALTISAYILAIREGKLKQIKIQKKYKNNKTYPMISMFRNGLAILIFFASSLEKFVKYLNQIKIKKNPFYKIV